MEAFSIQYINLCVVCDVYEFLISLVLSNVIMRCIFKVLKCAYYSITRPSVL